MRVTCSRTPLEEMASYDDSAPPPLAWMTIRSLDGGNACSLPYVTVPSETRESKCETLEATERKDLWRAKVWHMSPGVTVACRLMPELAVRIRVLALQNDAFVELCDDLAEAQRALEGVTLLPEAVRRHRLT